MIDRRPAFPPEFELILASQSPRRHSLLRDIGVPFTVASSEAEEVLEGSSAESIAEGNALAKLQGAVLPAGIPDGVFVLATDTVVAVESRVLGKASSEHEAAAMLAALSGRTHKVVSGVALARTGSSGTAAPGAAGQPPLFSEVRVRSSVTDVTFVSLNEVGIQAYVASGEWRGKAGAYAIQGLAAVYVSGIRGEFSNVVGLPLFLLGQMFQEMGFDLMRRQWV